MFIAVVACTPDVADSDDTLIPDPPMPDQPVEEVEQRIVTKVKITYTEDEGNYEYIYTHYLNYDEEGRVAKITSLYEECDLADNESWSGIEGLVIDYMSQDFIQITLDENGEVYEREYAYLNDKGYIESYDSEEYIYDFSGYLNKVSYLSDYGTTANAMYRWRNGNLSSVDEQWAYSYDNEEERYMYAFQYNTNDSSVINVDLSAIAYEDEGILGGSSLSWIGLTGKKSKNYVTSLTTQLPEGGKYTYTMKWSYDNNGYPKICRINHQHFDETGALCCKSDAIMEISYYDETGEVVPPQPVVREEPIVLSVENSSDVIELGETIYFIVEQDGEDVTSQCSIKCLTTGYYTDSPYYYSPTTVGTYEFIAEKGDITSNEVVITVVDVPYNISKWIGTYTATTYQELVFDGENEPYLRYKSNTFTVTIEYYSEEGWFRVCGLSSSLNDASIIGVLDEDNNLCLVDTYWSDEDGDGWQYMWFFGYQIYSDPDDLYGDFIYFKHGNELKFVMDAQGAITFMAEDITFDDGAMGSFTMADIFYYNSEENTIQHIANGFPIIYRAGLFDIRKISDDVVTPSGKNSATTKKTALNVRDGYSYYPLKMVNVAK